MNIFKKKLKEWVYSISTEDHYAEYNPDDEPNFNMGMRSGQPNPSSMNLAGNMSSTDINDSNNGYIGNDGDNAYQIDDFNTNAAESQKGVSEIILAWRHIDAWTDKHNPDLNATLSDPCTQNDITHAEEDLEISLPPSVRASLRIHDGQEDLESMTGTSGLIYGLQLMTLDQIVAMTQTWRNVARNLNKHKAQQQKIAMEMEQGSSTSQQTPSQETNQFKLPYIPNQNSIPPNTIQAAYAHPAWIPLVTDNAGNHIGVDLAPASEGSYGQVILFGREFDTKYVVADNWGEFMLAFANDLEIGNWYLIDDSDDYFSGEGELVFRDKKMNGPVQEYLEVLKRRVLQKYKESQAQAQNQNQTPAEEQIPQTQVVRTTVQDTAAEDTDFDIDDESIENVGTTQITPEIKEEHVVATTADNSVVVTKQEHIVEATNDNKPETETVEEEKVEEPVVEEEKKEEPVIEAEAETEPVVEEEKIEEPAVEEDKVEEPVVQEETEAEEAKEEVKEEEPEVEDKPETEIEEVKEEATNEADVAKENEEPKEENKDDVKELQNEFESVAL